ncbi:unnamed protein product [Merluccius merluccius]
MDGFCRRCCSVASDIQAQIRAPGFKRREVKARECSDETYAAACGAAQRESQTNVTSETPRNETARVLNMEALRTPWQHTPVSDNYAHAAVSRREVTALSRGRASVAGARESGRPREIPEGYWQIERRRVISLPESPPDGR